MRRNIVRLGHPILRFPAQAVDVESLEAGDFNDLINDLRDTLGASGAAALTAPQLGVELQILVFTREVLEAEGTSSDTQVVVNPMLEPGHGELIYDWEGCLSAPDLKGLVPRYPVVRLRGVDHVGAPVDLDFKGEASRVLQHAHDHLSGVMFVDRMRDLRSLAFADEWREYLSGTDLESAAGEPSD